VPALARRAHWDRNVGDRVQATCTVGRNSRVMTSWHGHAEVGASSAADGRSWPPPMASARAGAHAATRQATTVQLRIRVR
jgi:hypothetical protein